LGTKIPVRHMHCGIVTQKLSFWDWNFTILAGQSIRPLLGLSITWMECIGSYPSEVPWFGSWLAVVDMKFFLN
jgi:hypothetical protein